MRLASSAFEPGADIPQRFTCDGRDISPPLALHDIPAGAESLVLVMDDPDAPGGIWDHWVAYDIPVGHVIEEGIRTSAGRRSQLHGVARATAAPVRRAGRTPISWLYALDTMLHLPAGAEKAKVLEAIESHVLAEARLMGRYSRSGGCVASAGPPGICRRCLRRLTGSVLQGAGRPACRAGGSGRCRGFLTSAGSHGHEDAIREQEEHGGQGDAVAGQCPARPAVGAGHEPVGRRAEERREREVVEAAPTLLADALACVEAEEERGSPMARESCPRPTQDGPERPLNGTTTSIGVYGTLRSIMRTAAWTRARARAIPARSWWSVNETVR